MAMTQVLPTLIVWASMLVPGLNVIVGGLSYGWAGVIFGALFTPVPFVIFAMTDAFAHEDVAAGQVKHEFKELNDVRLAWFLLAILVSAVVYLAYT
jgi:hypothetical protein